MCGEPHRGGLGVRAEVFFKDICKTVPWMAQRPHDLEFCLQMMTFLLLQFRESLC